MARTTIALNDALFEKLSRLARQENRSTPNLIETILIRHLEDDLYADDFEMEDIRRDRGLQRSIRKGMADYKAGRGRIME